MRPQRAVDDEQPGPYEFARVIGQSNTGAGVSHPVALAIDREAGILYVASRRFARISTWTRDGDYVGQFGRSNPTDFSEVPAPNETGVYWPAGLAYAGQNGSGALFITEEAHHRVRKLSPSGDVLAIWGAAGADGAAGEAQRMPRGDRAPGRFDRPSGIAVDREGRIHVADTQNHRVQQLGSDGDVLAIWGSHGDGPDQLDMPWGVAVDDARGRLFVSDWRNDRVQELDLDGRFVGSFGRPGSAPGEFNRPAGIAVDADGNVAVADWGNDRVQVLAPDGTPQAVLVGRGDRLSKAAQQTLNAREEMARAYEAYGGLHPLDRFFWLPTDVAFDADGTLYVADTLRQRLQVYRRRN
jgi:DNA-binding beta-propeller fold protein YncE